MKTKQLILILAILTTSLSALAETFTIRVVAPSDKVEFFAKSKGWQETITSLETVDKEVEEDSYVSEDSGQVDANGSAIMTSRLVKVTKTIQVEEPVTIPNPVSAATYAAEKAEKAFIEILSQPSVDYILANKEAEKQAEVKAAKEQVSAGVTVEIAE